MQKPLKVAAWSGIFVIIFSLSNLIIYFVFLEQQRTAEIFSLIFYVLISISFLIFMWGFVVLSRKFNNGLLNVSSWIYFILFLLVSIFLIIMYLFFVPLGFDLAQLEDAFIAWDNPESGEFPVKYFGFAVVFLTFLFVLFVAYIALVICRGIGIKRLEGEVPLAKVTGILNIIGGATLIVFGLGGFVLMVAFFFEIAMLFQASKKFESGKVPQKR